ncbi:MAG: competence/damage-inducible protein A [Chloroflexi bacterium]|nr:competence/damage-inducible protein A [Chloroflexota bacterium]
MPSAEIIAIGTELLLGDIQDTNTRDLALFLRENGISLYRTTMVGDNLQRISAAIHESLTRVDIVITSGGLGPTVDDPTREAVALATGTQTVFMPELWSQIENRFKRFGRKATDNNRKQAYIPEGAIPVENQVGTAPAFIVETGEKIIISLPGVPKELHYLLDNKIKPYLQIKFPNPEIIKALVLHTAGAGESQVDEWISDLETYVNPTVGLLAHPGQVDIRITARASSTENADQMIARVAKEVYRRVGDYIYGENGDTQEKAVQTRLSQLGWKVVVNQQGMGKDFIAALIGMGIQVDLDGSQQDHFENLLNGNLSVSQVSHPDGYDVFYKIVLKSGRKKQHLSLRLKTPLKQVEEIRTYGGPAQSKDDWAANQALDFLRRQLL